MVPQGKEPLQADSAVRSAPAPGMAQLRIRAVGLNFRDVLNVARNVWICRLEVKGGFLFTLYRKQQFRPPKPPIQSFLNTDDWRRMSYGYGSKFSHLELDHRFEFVLLSIYQGPSFRKQRPHEFLRIPVYLIVSRLL